MESFKDTSCSSSVNSAPSETPKKDLCDLTPRDSHTLEGISEVSAVSSVSDAETMECEPMPLSESVRRCTYALMQAHDNEHKLAALMMVTKLIKAENLTDKEKIRLFNAIGRDFLITLLRGESVPEDCSSSIFKSIAMSILACFVTTDHKMSFYQELIPDFLCIIADPELRDGNLSTIQCAYECIYRIVLHKSGRKEIISKNGMSYLVDAYINEDLCQEFVLKILVGMLFNEGNHAWKHDPESFTKLASYLCGKFVVDQSESKFELCSALVEVLHSMPTSLPASEYEWQKQLHQGLCDILFSKLGKDHRHQGLTLAAAALEFLGAYWVVAAGPKGHQLMLIMVHLACVEVRMSLENETFEKTIELAPQTTSCYSLLENAIKFLINGALEMEEKQKQQLYSALKGAFNSVLHFLKEVSEEKVHTSNKPTQMFVCATIRVLSAWLAEETAANKDEVYTILPFVIGVCHYNFDLNKNTELRKSQKVKDPCEAVVPDLIKFMLPGLCHLTAEDQPRHILLEVGLEQLLFDYFLIKYESLDVYLILYDEKDEALQKELPGTISAVCETLVTLFSIFMNIVVTTQSEVQANSIYLRLLKFIISKITKIPLTSVFLPLYGNMSVLGLMILKHHFSNVNSNECGMFRFIQCTVRFLWDAHNVEESLDYATLVVSFRYNRHWCDLMELWYLGMHNLMTLLPSIPWLCDFLLECDWPQTIIQTLQLVRQGGVEAGLKTVLEDMLCMIARCSTAATQALRQADAVRVAGQHGMTALIAQLQK